MSWPRPFGLRSVPSKPFTRPAKPTVRLELEQLEVRQLFSLGLGTLPPKALFSEGPTGQSPWLSLFQPGDSTLRPLGGQDTASLSVLGDFTLTRGGSYTLNFAASGTTSGHTFTVTAAGEITFSLTVTGTYSNGTATVVTQSLTQTGTLTYAYQEWAGETLVVDLGDTVAVESTATSGLLDGLAWQRFGWDSLIGQLSADEELDLDSKTWSGFSLTATGSHSFSLDLDGTRTLAGTGSRNLDGVPGTTGTETYSYTGLATFTLDHDGAGTFSLYEQGSYSSGSYALASYNYAASGSHTVAFHEDSLQTLSGTGVRSSTDTYALNQGGAWGGGSFSQSDGHTLTYLETYTFLGHVTMAYAETSAGTFAVYERGTYTGGSFALGSVGIDQTAQGTYLLDEEMTRALAGTGVRTSLYQGQNLGNTGLGGSTGSASGSYTSTGRETYTLDAVDSADYHVTGATASMAEHRSGSYGNGSYALDSFAYHLHSQETFSLAASSHGTLTGTGSFAASGEGSSLGTSSGSNGSLGALGCLNSTATDSYAFNAWAHDTLTANGTAAYSAFQGGSYGNGSFALSSYAQDATGTTSLYQFGAQSLALSGTGTYVETAGATSLGTTSRDGASGTGSSASAGQATYSYLLGGTLTAETAGFATATFAAHRHGSYALGSFSLSSVTAASTSTAVLSLTAVQALHLTGTASQSLSASGAGTGSMIDSALGTSAYASSGSYTVSAVDTVAFTLDGVQSLAAQGTITAVTHAGGQYSGYSLALAEFAVSESGTSSYALFARDTLTYAGGGVHCFVGGYQSGGTVGLLDGNLAKGGNRHETRTEQGRETFSYTGDAHSTFQLTGTSTFSSYLEGSTAGASLALASLAVSSDDFAVLTLQADSHLTYTLGHGVVTITRSGTGTELFSQSGLDSYALGSGQCYSAEEVTTYTFALASINQFVTAADTLALYAQSATGFAAVGCYSLHSLALDSFTATGSVSVQYSLSGAAGGGVNGTSLLTGSAWQGSTGTSSFTPGGGVQAQSGGQGRALSHSGVQVGTFSSGLSVSQSALGTVHTDSYLRGRYALESLALDSFTVHAAGTGTAALTLNVYEGGTSLATVGSLGTTTHNGSRSGPTGGGSSLATETYARQLIIAEDAGTSLTLAYRGTETYSLHREGSYAGHSVTLSSLAADVQATSRVTLTLAGGASQDWDATLTYNWDSGGNQTSTASGTETFAHGTFLSDLFTAGSLNTTSAWSYAQETLSLHLEGAYAQGSYSLASLCYDHRGTSDSGSSYLYADDGSGTQGVVRSGTGQYSGATSYYGSGGETFAQNGTQSYDLGAGGLDQDTAQQSWHLHQEGVYAGGSYALSCIVWEATGTLGNSAQGTYTSGGEGTDSYTQSGSGGDGVGTGGGGGSFSSLGTYGQGGQHSYAYAYTDQTARTGAGGSTYSLYQAGSYAHGSYSLSSYLYQARGSQSGDNYTTGSESGSSAGTLTGSATGYQQALHQQGTYTYAGSSNVTWTSHESTVYSYAVREEGGYGALPTVILEESGSSSWTYLETQTSSSSGSGFAESHSQGYHSTGTSAFSHYERGSRQTGTWALASYLYSTSGHSLDTILTSDSSAACYSSTGASYYQTRNALGTSVSDSTWNRFETGSRAAGEGLSTFQPFSWASYTESSHGSSTATSVETVITDNQWTEPPPEGWYIGGANGGIHTEQVTTETSTYSGSFFGQGPETSGPSFSFTSYTYAEDSDWNSVTAGTGVSWTGGGLKPGSTTTWTWSDSTAVTRDLDQAGSGLTGNYTLTDTGTRTHSEQGATNGISFGPFSSTQSHTTTQTGTFALIAPTPQAIEDYPAYMPLENAQGKNLLGQGFTAGDRPGNADPAASASNGVGGSGGAAGGDGRQGFGPGGGDERNGFGPDQGGVGAGGANGGEQKWHPGMKKGQTGPTAIPVQAPNVDMAELERLKLTTEYQEAFKQARGFVGPWWMERVDFWIGSVASGLDPSDSDFIPTQIGRSVRKTYEWATSNPAEAVHRALDVADALDPSFLSGTANGILYLAEGNWKEGVTSIILSFLPYAGDALKNARNWHKVGPGVIDEIGKNGGKIGVAGDTSKAATNQSKKTQLAKDFDGKELKPDDSVTRMAKPNSKGKIDKGEFEPTKRDLGIDDWKDQVPPGKGISVDGITTGATPGLKGEPIETIARRITEASNGRLKVVHRPLPDNPYHTQIEPAFPMTGEEFRQAARYLFEKVWKDSLPGKM